MAKKKSSGCVSKQMSHLKASGIKKSQRLPIALSKCGLSKSKKKKS